ncbi:MAG TPA: glycosyltransferase family 87 protein [Bryobacteraceae bacterium]|nr:glycosyltransferase family 87 protein [Bryobacteraceae bacterium]
MPKRAAIAGVCLLGLALFAVALYYRPPAAALDDFLPTYRASRLLGSPDMFAQTSLHAQGHMYLRTPFYAWLLHPLGALDYALAYRLWMVLMVAAFALSAWLWPGTRWKIVVAMCWSFPVLSAIGIGQDTALMMLSVAVAARLWMGGREFAAGLVASVVACKISFLLPVGLVFLLRSRRGLGGLAAGAALQCAISLAVQGPAWIPEYLAAVRSPWLDHFPARMPSVRALLSGAPFMAASVAIYGWLVWVVRRISPAQALTVALPLAVVAAPHCYSYDMAVAVPLLAGVASTRTARGMLALAALTPAPYLFMALAHPHPAGAAILVAAVLASSTVVAATAPNAASGAG